MKQKAISILKQYNQEQVIDILEKMPSKYQKNLIEQILKLDFKEIDNIYNELKNGYKEDLKTIEPVKYTEKIKLSKEEKDTYEEIGRKIIKENKLAVITVAGGQGTRLGHKGPKGTYELDLWNEIYGKKASIQEEFGKEKCVLEESTRKVSIFEVLAQNFIRAKSEYNVDICWYIMLSNENKVETLNFFENNNYFGLKKENIIFFVQKDIPVIDENGKILVGTDYLIKTASNGNGGIYEALNVSIIDNSIGNSSDLNNKNMKKESIEIKSIAEQSENVEHKIVDKIGDKICEIDKNKKLTVLETLMNNQTEWIFVSGVDNILVNPIDPLFIGLTIRER